MCIRDRYKTAQIPGKMILKSLKPIVPIVIFTAVLNLFFVTGQGEPLVHFWVFKIYAEGVKYAILLAVRVCALIAGTSLLTYTTSPIVLTDAIESLLRPLAKVHFPGICAVLYSAASSAMDSASPSGFGATNSTTI